MINFLQEDYIRCVLPDTPLPLGENGNYLVKFFKDTYDITIEYLEETKTIRGTGKRGGRIDQIFNVLKDDTDQFDQIKSKIGARYGKDIVRNGEHRVYTERIFLQYFKRIENDLLKNGELSEENVYQTKLS